MNGWSDPSELNGLLLTPVIIFQFQTQELNRKLTITVCDHLAPFSSIIMSTHVNTINTIHHGFDYSVAAKTPKSAGVESLWNVGVPRYPVCFPTPPGGWDTIFPKKWEKRIPNDVRFFKIIEPNSRMLSILFPEKIIVHTNTAQEKLYYLCFRTQRYSFHIHVSLEWCCRFDRKYLRFSNADKIMKTYWKL